MYWGTIHYQKIWTSCQGWCMVALVKFSQSFVEMLKCWACNLLGSKDLGFYIFRTLICIVGKPWSKQCI